MIDNFKKYLIIYLQISITFYLIFDFFKTDFEFQNEKIYFNLVNLFLNLILLNLIFFLFYKKKIIKQYSKIILISVLVSLYSFELILNIKHIYNKPVSLFNYYEKKIKKNKDIVVTVPPCSILIRKIFFHYLASLNR